MQVLVIDDDVAASRFLTMQLQMLGCQARHAPGGRQGLEMVTEAAPQLIFLDYQMPEMDGLATARELRAQGYAGRIVGLTGEDSPEMRQRCLDAGMDDYRCKPLQLDGLKQVLESLKTRDPLAKARALAEKSGFPALAQRLVDNFVKTAEGHLEKLDTERETVLPALVEATRNFGAEDYLQLLQQGADTARLRSEWEKLKPRLQL